jgi:hypothetical protein
LIVTDPGRPGKAFRAPGARDGANRGEKDDFATNAACGLAGPAKPQAAKDDLVIFSRILLHPSPGTL